ncbi:hypothetical protein ACVWYF_002993 [Hymenobacter sp. UYAg731]
MKSAIQGATGSDAAAFSPFRFNSTHTPKQYAQ